MYEFKPLKIKNFEIKFPIIQGGMGVGISLHPLTRAVGDEGGLGILSSACLDSVVFKRDGAKKNIYGAVRIEIEKAKEGKRLVGINIMAAIFRQYEDSVRAAIDAGADAIISGAGLPLNLPAICNPKDTALIPIVSSARALEIIVKKWERLGYRPDAVVLEGPLAGGHLGFKIEDINRKENELENLFGPIKEVAMKYGDFPVIVAGGIYSHEDIVRFLKMGADGAQMGTRFLTTQESGANNIYKTAVVGCGKNDIVIANPDNKNSPGSPCGLPFRIIKWSPLYSFSKLRQPLCNRGYVLQKDNKSKFTICKAREDNKKYFCICNGLLSAAGLYTDKELPLWTVGANAWRVNKILPVKELMDRLKGVKPED